MTLSIQTRHKKIEVAVQENEELISSDVEIQKSFVEMASIDFENCKASEMYEICEQSFRSIVETATDAIININHLGDIVFWNRAAENIFGYKVSEVIGKNIDLIIPENMSNSHELAIKKFIRTSQARLKGKTVEVIGVAKDGTEFPIEISIACWKVADNIFFTGIIRDISQRKLAEQELLELATAVQTSDDAIISITLDYKIKSWNKGAERIFGYSTAEVKNKPYSLIVPDEIYKEVPEVIDKLKNGEQIINYETVRKRKDQSLINISSTASLIKDKSGEILGINAIIRDITHKKEMEREMARLDRLHLVGEMAAGIGHEIRNPMTTVRGFLQLLGEKNDKDEDKDIFELMISELDRANMIITEFLSMAKNKSVVLERKNLNDIIKKILPLIEAEAIINHQVILELNKIPDLLLDEKEIRQLIYNFVYNGLEAMIEGGYLNIKTYLDNGAVVLAIQDSGNGIDNEILDKIGTPFFTTKDTGTGLGLAMCYSIAERHNAAISFDTGHHGTTFYIKFKEKDIT